MTVSRTHASQAYILLHGRLGHYHTLDVRRFIQPTVILYGRGDRLNTASLRALVKEFGVLAQDMTRLRSGVYRITGSGGQQYALKRMRHHEDHQLYFIDRTLCHLRAQSVRVAWRSKDAPDGRKAFVRLARNGDPYVLTPWIAGRRPLATDPLDLQTCAHTLAQFHEASKGVIHTPRDALWGLHQWPDVLRRRTAGIEARLMEARGRQGELAMLLREVGPDLLQAACEVETGLWHSGYRQLCQRAQEDGVQICHGDCGDANFVLTADGAYLIDFETLRVDLPAFDLYRLIRLQAKANHWDKTSATMLLDAYQEVRPLSFAELQLVILWLQYPRKASRVLRSDLIWEDQSRVKERVLSAVSDMQCAHSLIEPLQTYAQSLL